MSTELEASKVLVIGVKVTAALSLLCSGYIVYSIISNPEKRSLPRERIILGLSCSDILFSLFWFLNTWPIPRGTENVYGAVGNTQTCDVQGFFLQLGIMTPMYNGFLALYCFLYVFKDLGRQRMKFVEISGHIVILAVGFSTAIAGLSLELYNSGRIVCFIASLPRDCAQSIETIDGTTDCIRGDNSIIYRWAFYHGIIATNILLTVCSFFLIYLHIRKQEKTMDSYTAEFMTTRTTSRNSNSDSREVALRGALFTGAFLLTWVPGTIAEGLRMSSNPMYFEEVFPLVVVLTTLVPSQGVFNFLIYVQPTVSRHLKERNRRRIERLQASGEQKDERQQAHSSEENQESSKGYSPDL